MGKSALLKKLNADLSIDLLNPALQLSYNKNPNLLRHEIDEHECNITVLIDEIQRAPRLLDVVHAIMEEKPEIRFILCGSSARKLRHGASNLLEGRALYRTMHPLTFEELSDDFNLSMVMQYGSLPKIYTFLTKKMVNEARDLLRTYVITYLKEEIKDEALVRSLHGFQNFLDVATAQYAEQVNFSAISRDCQVALSTVREYYSILEDTLIGFFLYPYLKSQRKRMSCQPKFYFFDNGVTRAILGTLLDPPSPLEKGRLFEQWVVQEILRFNEYHQKDWKLTFWRTGNGAEVDLLISRGPKLLYAIECKLRPDISSKDLTGLKSFHEINPDVPCFVVAPVKNNYRFSFARVISPEEMLEELK